jgi:hypothetical protein
MDRRLKWAREYRKRARDCRQTARFLSLDYQREALLLEAARYKAMADELEAEIEREPQQNGDPPIPPAPPDEPTG